MSNELFFISFQFSNNFRDSSYIFFHLLAKTILHDFSNFVLPSQSIKAVEDKYLVEKEQKSYEFRSYMINNNT